MLKKCETALRESLLSRKGELYAFFDTLYKEAKKLESSEKCEKCETRLRLDKEHLLAHQLNSDKNSTLSYSWFQINKLMHSFFADDLFENLVAKVSADVVSRMGTSEKPPVDVEGFKMKIGELRSLLYKQTFDYQSELVNLRSQVLKKSNTNFIDVRYFDASQCADPDLREILNGKLDQMKQQFL